MDPTFEFVLVLQVTAHAVKLRSPHGLSDNGSKLPGNIVGFCELADVSWEIVLGIVFCCCFNL